MSDELFRLILDLYMASDPSPLPFEDDDRLKSLLSEASRERGFNNWIDAYHRFQKETPA